MINILKNDLNNEDDNNCNLNKQDDDPLLSSLPPLPILPLPQPDLKPQVSLLSCNRATIYDDHDHDVDSIAVSLFTNSETAATTPWERLQNIQRALNQ